MSILHHVYQGTEVIRFTVPHIGKAVAEEFGIHIGDGSLGIYPTTGHYDYTITGGLEDEKYLLEFIVPLIYINGKKNLHQFIEKIGFSNIKHMTKYQLWKLQRFLEPNTSLNERLSMLNNMCRSSSVVERHSLLWGDAHKAFMSADVSR